MVEKREGHVKADSSEEVIEEAAKEAEHLLFTDMAQYMSQFARSFEASARRWELVVYPSLLAFIVLAIYGYHYRMCYETFLSAVTPDSARARGHCHARPPRSAS